MPSTGSRTNHAAEIYLVKSSIYFVIEQCNENGEDTKYIENANTLYLFVHAPFIFILGYSSFLIHHDLSCPLLFHQDGPKIPEKAFVGY